MEILINYEGKVPAKANRYKIGKGKFYVDTEVTDFEDYLTQLFILALPRAVDWAIPKKLKTPRPVNAIFPAPVKTEVSLIYFCPSGKGIDLDNVLKAVLDAATHAGVWSDDRQVKTIHIIQQDAVDYGLQVHIQELVIKKIIASPSPLRRKEWIEQRKAEESFNRPDEIVTTYCDRCGIAVGPFCLSEEVWLLPHFRKRGWLTFEIICGICADRHELSFIYRAIDLQTMRTLRRFQVGPIVQKRIKELKSDYIARKAKCPSSTRSSRNTTSI